MKHILSSKQFSRDDLKYLMGEAAKMDALLSKWGSRIFYERIMATLFYEPSTRTRLSFEVAMHRLWGRVVSETDVTFSSQSKGEILIDTIRIVSGYADVIAIRSKNTGDAKLASEYSHVPIINAWDGSGKHPTQALLDLYTITKEFPHILEDAHLSVTFIGDLRYGRNVYSLSILMRNFPNVKMHFIVPEWLNLPEEYKKDGDIFQKRLDDASMKDSDIVYMTRVPKEWFPSIESYEAAAKSYILIQGTVTIVMHALPRVYGDSYRCRSLPQAHYSEQARNAIHMRMAVIQYCLEN